MLYFDITDPCIWFWSKKSLVSLYDTSFTSHNLAQILLDLPNKLFILDSMIDFLYFNIQNVEKWG